jgi:hypothetical protein
MASLIHLGAKNLFLLEQDKAPLDAEINDYFPADKDGMPKILGQLCPAFTLDNLKYIFDNKEDVDKTSFTNNYPVMSSIDVKGKKQSYIENVTHFLAKYNYPQALESQLM